MIARAGSVSRVANGGMLMEPLMSKELKSVRWARGIKE